MKKTYDYLLVGAGLFNAVFAYMAKLQNKRVLVIDKRKHLGGNVYSEKINGITVHKYGPHIFHTDNEDVWKFVNRFVPFNQYNLNTIAINDGKLYNLPFNMHTYQQMWGVIEPEKAFAIIEHQKAAIANPQNLEEQAISLVGYDIYKTLIKGYTEKQWGRSCRELPVEIIKRLPVRNCFNNSYFNDRFQGIPEGGYNVLINGLLKGIECHTECDYIKNRDCFDCIADKTVYTGPIDEFFDYQLGKLEYRSLLFKQETLQKNNYQGIAVINYTNARVPYTRIVEHKWFDIHNIDVINAPYTVITREYPQDYTMENEPYYPINDKRNNALYREYVSLGREKYPNVVFAGRLGGYKYFDMDKSVAEAMVLARKEYEYRT